jgi:phosphoglycolate phosphatase-like HAD superfamily hydrolase
MKNIIFDLDGTLALIDDRRALSTKDNGKIDWDIFFDPNNINLDKPNHPVIKVAQMFKDSGFRIVILSGRLKTTKDVTKKWLQKFNVPFDVIKMRPDNNQFKFMPDDDLKQGWLDTLFTNKDDVFAVFDDRKKVVDMWRSNGLNVFQVADGNF